MSLNSKFLADKSKSILSNNSAITYNEDIRTVVNSIYSSEDRISIPGRNIITPDLTPKFLGITVTNLEDVSSTIGDATSLSDWNNFFETSTYANTPFTSINVVGTTEIQLFGATNLSLRAALFSPSKVGYDWIVSIDDQTGSITDISDIVFIDCNNLVSLNLPNVKRFGFDTFYSCNNLTTVIAPSLLLVTDYAFENCPNIVTMNFPECLFINRNTFSSCESIETINLPKVLSIDTYSFLNCTSLTSIYLPSLSSIGEGDTFSSNSFSGITGNTISFTLPQRLMTCNYGNPHPDVQTLIDNNTVNIITV